MTRPTDEILMAYDDNALDPAELARVDAYLAMDANALALVATFRKTAVLARAAYGAPFHEPPPRFLVEYIMKQPTGQRPASMPMVGSPGGAKAIDLAARRRSSRRSDALRLPLAASVALLVGLGAGFLVSDRGTDWTGEELSVGVVAKSAPLAEVLERRPSGMATGRHVVVATFRDRLNRVCREIELLNLAQSARTEIAAVACRSRDGTWTVEGASRLVAAAPAAPSIEPSGVAERDALDGLLNVLGAKPVLSRAEEKALIERGWQ